MTEITLYNTATRSKERFDPIDPKNVRMYVCGPTVYDRAHIGNARPVIVFDTLFRLLRHVYGEEAVTYVRNFTDVDDKINATALQRKEAGAPGTLEELIAERTNETIGWYHADMEALGTLRPTQEPRATAFIGQMIAMIEGLVAKGHAYAAEGHVLFRVRSYEQYGALSGRSVDDMIAGARVEVAPYKEDPMDFVLWKPSSDDLPGWESPWGRGRPGWHIECSAMAYELLGERFDIHGGGNDLQFPHHENEIAQSKCAGHAFANVWMHNEMLQVEGKKMSKSLGNFFTVRDLLDGNWSGGWKVPGEVIRFVFLSTHYRKPMDWTEAKAREAEATLRKWAKAVEGVEPANTVDPVLIEALSDDLNTAGAIARLHALFKEGNLASVHRSLTLMGINLNALETNPDRTSGLEEVHQLLALRDAAKAARDFRKADYIRDSLISLGFEVRDDQSGAAVSIDDVALLQYLPTTKEGEVRVSIFGKDSIDTEIALKHLRLELQKKLEALL